MITNLSEVTDEHLGIWIDRRDYPHVKYMLTDIIDFAIERGFSFSNMDTYYEKKEAIPAADLDDELHQDAWWLTVDAVSWMIEQLPGDKYTLEVDDCCLSMIRVPEIDYNLDEEEEADGPE